jgi:hypothetical protein
MGALRAGQGRFARYSPNARIQTFRQLTRMQFYSNRDNPLLQAPRRKIAIGEARPTIANGNAVAVAAMSRNALKSKDRERPSALAKG